MKKLLTLVVLLVFVAGSAFAGVTSVTKENSQAGYPGELTPGSINGTSTFISDLPLLANTVILEYVWGIYGMVALKTDLGTIGISISPSIEPYVNSIWTNNNPNTIGLQYATGLSGMPVGIALLYGNNSGAYENKDIVNNTVNNDDPNENPWSNDYDKENRTDSHLGVKLGAGIKGDMPIDVALGFAMDTYYRNQKDIDNVANGVVLANYTDDQIILGFDLSGRVGLGNGITAVLGGTYNMGTDKDTDLEYDAAGTKTADDVATETNNYLRVGALIGKDIKATDTLTVKLATGAMFSMDQDEKNVYKDNMPLGTTTYDAPVNVWSEVYVDIPLNVAVEGKLNDTWSINAGVNATILSSDNDTTKYNTDADAYDPQARFTQSWLNITPSLGYAIGVTGKIGDLTLDLYLNPTILINGPYLISGSSTGNLDMNFAVGYNWK